MKVINMDIGVSFDEQFSADYICGAVITPIDGGAHKISFRNFAKNRNGLCGLEDITVRIIKKSSP